MKNKFDVHFVSDSEHEQLTAEIMFDGQILYQITQDLGDENYVIEFFHEFYLHKKDTKFKFQLSEFLQIINAAVDDLN